MAVTDWKFCRRATGGWTNTNNILTENGALASFEVPGYLYGSPYTPILVGDDFGFADADIPAGSTILGIECRIKAQHQAGTALAVHLAYLRKVVGSNVGDNKATSLTLSATLAKSTAGGSGDLWGTTWSVAEVKDAGFGFAYQARNDYDEYASFCYVDCIEARVHFTPPAASSGSSSPIPSSPQMPTQFAKTQFRRPACPRR